jgi:sulfatase maturation enzyme AslB (radical SAM superfamily)
MRLRKEPSANYSAVFIDGKTIRIPLNPRLPITELHFPEFYDLSPGTKCSGGCDYCYAGALKTGEHYTKLAQKVNDFFGPMTLNQRPFQVAIGGQQEPLENPEIWDMMRALRALDIVPNYTTNGMFVTEEVVQLTKEIAGGVAVTLHPHLERFWRRALARFAAAQVKLNIHIVISDKESIDKTAGYYKEFIDSGMVDYFVLLPYMNYGHAKNHPRTINYAYFEQWVDTIYKEGKLAFGANFFNFLKRNAKKYAVSLYPPEIMSKYLIMDDKMEVSNNSFEKKPVNFVQGVGCQLGMARTEFISA